MAMYQGNWKCSVCGGEITELPFQPRSENGLTCRSCFAKSRGSQSNSQPAPEAPVASAPQPDDVPHFAETQLASEEPPLEDAFAGMDTSAPATAGEKPKFSGDWSCAICGAAIATLPFNPSRTDNLKCLDCFKESRQ